LKNKTFPTKVKPGEKVPTARVLSGKAFGFIFYPAASRVLNNLYNFVDKHS
jgi:hypothetical protein